MTRTSIRRAPARNRSFSSASSLLELLEPRLVFAAPFDFVAAGLRFDNGPQVFFTEGVIEADDSITGDTTLADHAGATTMSPIDWTSYIRGDGGSFTFGTRNGFTPYATQF